MADHGKDTKVAISHKKQQIQAEEKELAGWATQVCPL
jgi:hypothetical protein